MIKTKKLLSLLTSTFLLITICAAAPSHKSPAMTETQEIEDESPTEEPANIVFVKELQKYLDNDDIKGAISLFDKLPEELSSDLGLKSLQASLLYSDKEFTKAISVSKEILKENPKDMETLELLALCYKGKGDTKSYKEISDKILKEDPYNPTINIEKANEFVLSKKWKQARSYYGNALRGDGNNTEAMFGYAKMSYYLDDLQTAEKYLNKIISIDPYNAEALAYKGTIEFDKENYLLASDYVSQAIRIDPYNKYYWLDYGKYLQYQGKLDDAIKAWEKAIEIDPTYFLAYGNIASVYDERGEFDKALENYRKVIETNPDYFYAYETAAILEYHAGNYKNAINYFQKAYEYNPSYSYSLMTAACYFKLNDSFHAKKILEAQMKKLNRQSTEYDLVRFFHDSYSRNAESTLLRKIEKTENSNDRGKMYYYMGLYNEIYGSDVIAKEFYSKVIGMKAPMFFEYRLAEWGMEE